MRKWLDAEKTASRILQRDPHHPIARARRALALYNLGRFADAQKVYNSVVVDYPSDVEMMSGIGWCQLKQGKAQEAIQTFEKALLISPEHSSALQGLATLNATQ
ncbi:MAG: tetratricopeptide repeat protein [Myxococcales bacterium]|nr:MAG: tetratricopeptide repeat protein [Myxococcales bacterium]